MLSLRGWTLCFAGICCLSLVMSTGLFGQAATDQTKEISLKGTVENVSLVPAYGRTYMHVRLKTGNQSVDVSLGPTRWLDANQFSVAGGDTLQVVGTKVKGDTGEVLLAREVVSGDQRLELGGGPATSSGRGYYCRGMGCGGHGCGHDCGADEGYCRGCGSPQGGCRGSW